MNFLQRIPGAFIYPFKCDGSFFIHIQGQASIDNIFWLLAGIGALYFPMGLLAVAVYDSLGGLNPLVVITSMIKIPYQYLFAIVGLSLIIMLSLAIQTIVSEYLPIVNGFILTITALYFAAVEMRILGLLYASNRVELQWF